MMTPKRPHLLDSLRFFRYGFLLCLVPMVQALFRFDMEGLVIALWQDAAIWRCAWRSRWRCGQPRAFR